MAFTNALLVLSAILILGKQGFAQLLNEECRPTYRPMIIGGLAADRAPWMAYLISDGRFHCGGSLIANRFVLTAKHCANVTLDNLIVRLGEYDTLTTKDGPHEDFEVKIAFLHGTADIAILKLDRSVEYNDNIKPICIILNTRMEMTIDAIPSLTITGWGRTNRYTRVIATKLQQATIQRMHPFYCNYPTGQFCGRNPTQFICFGDSGSPLGANINYNGVTIYAQIGVASSVETAECNTYGNYVDVMSYTFWIRRTIEKSI